MRTLNEQIQRLRDVLVTCYNAIKRKGGTIPEVGERNMYNLPAAVRSIPQSHTELVDLEVTANGEYLPADHNADGFSKVTVRAEFDPNIRVADGCYYEDGSRTEYGMSLAHLLCSSLNITKLIDANTEWIMTKALDLPSLEEVQLGCKESTTIMIQNNQNLKTINYPELVNSAELFWLCPNIETINIPKLEVCSLTQTGTHIFYFIGNNQCVNISAPKLHTVNGHPQLWGNSLFRDLPKCKTISAPNLTTWNYQWHLYNSSAISNCPKLETVILPSAHFSLYDSFANCDSLIHIEIAPDYSQSLALWSPTTALSERLPEFLYNFQYYIADRVADMTGKTALTLTLSSAVYAALEAQEGQTILATLANKNWNVAQA